MSASIDPFLDLHFADLVESFGGQEELVVSLRPETAEPLPATPGVQILQREENVLRVRATLPGQRALHEMESVVKAEPATRRDTVPILVQLRDSNWNREVSGLQKGSRLGSVLTARATEPAIRELEADPDVIAVEASRPFAVSDCVNSMPRVNATTVHRPPYSEEGDKALVAIIDGGIDVLHAAFRNPDNTTRLIALWDQTSSLPTVDTPQAAAAAGVAKAPYTQTYGRYYSSADINGFITAGSVPPELGRDTRKHGTHVASIAAGSPFTDSTGVHFPGGVAPQARIVAVIPKLLAGPGDPASLGYSVAHVDALAFIKLTARAEQLPVAVNVSQGMNAGAHDGTSLLETAFDEFSGGGREAGYVVVKSAGNEHRWQGHAEVAVSTGTTAVIEWITTKVPRVQDYLEFWFASGDDLEFTLSPPTGSSIYVDKRTTRAQGNLTANAGTCYLSLERFHHDNGDGQLMVLCRHNANKAFSAAGSWKLEITGARIVSSGNVHGWVERNPRRPLRFITAQTASRDLSIPGTARTVICVGACDSLDPFTVQPFSSRGPARDDRQKPELVAPGKDIMAAAAGTDGDLRDESGTSMAAPHVTGAIALLLSRQAKKAGANQLNAAQIRAALRQCTHKTTGSWKADEGFGRLDVQGLIDIFD